MYVLIKHKEGELTHGTIIYTSSSKQWIHEEAKNMTKNRNVGGLDVMYTVLKVEKSY